MNAFWAKLFFSEFCEHFDGMTNEEIVKDVKDSRKIFFAKISQKDYKSLGNTFADKMIKSAEDRIAKTSDVRTVAAQARWSRQQPTAEQQPIVKPRPLKPPSVQQLYDFCADNSIDEAYAREWYEMCSDRQWKDRAMKPIENWKGALVNYVKNKQTS